MRGGASGGGPVLMSPPPVSRSRGELHRWRWQRAGRAGLQGNHGQQCPELFERRRARGHQVLFHQDLSHHPQERPKMSSAVWRPTALPPPPVTGGLPSRVPRGPGSLKSDVRIASNKAAFLKPG